MTSFRLILTCLRLLAHKNLVALPITSQELDIEAILPPPSPKIGRVVWPNHKMINHHSSTKFVTLLSAQVSSESPFCNTTLLRKQLISPILFGLAKIGKKDVVLYSLGNRKICKSQCFRYGSLCKLFFQKFLFISEKWIYLQNYWKNCWFSFAMFLARLLIYNFTNSD